MNEFNVNINESEYIVNIISEDVINVNGKDSKYELIEMERNKFLLKLDNQFYEIIHLDRSDVNHIILVNASALNLSIRTSLESKAYKLLNSAQSGKEKVTNIKSPMPGLVLKINKTVGDPVSKGETVLILEAMKMENEIKAPVDGLISGFFVQQGKPVEKNINLFSIK